MSIYIIFILFYFIFLFISPYYANFVLGTSVSLLLRSLLDLIYILNSASYRLPVRNSHSTAFWLLQKFYCF